MKNDKIVYVLIAVAGFLVGTYFFLNREDDQSTSVNSKKIDSMQGNYTELTTRLNTVIETQGTKLDSIENSLVVISEKIDGLAIANNQTKVKPPPDKKKKKPEPPKTDPNKVYDVAIGNSVVLGNLNAKVTIVEWTDFQ